jgi:hypothetical protein
MTTELKPLSWAQNHSWRVSATVLLASMLAGPAAAQTAREVEGAAAVVPLQQEPPAKLIVDPALPEPLSFGRVVIQYRADNLHMVPVFGAAAALVSPRIGHVHVTLDGAPWMWMQGSGQPLILNGLPPGPHQILIELETANHQTLDRGTVKFTVPTASVAASSAAQTAVAQTATLGGEPPAKIIIGSPQAEPLSRGVLIVSYRTENMQIVPVFGPAALAVSPRVGHIHVTVDDAAWHWADASGEPVIVNGLAPGRHKVLIQLVNADHKPLDQGVVEFIVPAKSTAMAR